MSTERPLETGWLPDTPVRDTLLRQFVFNQADVNRITAEALGGRVDATDDVFLADTGTPVPYLNQALLTRPLSGTDDPALDVVQGFFADADHPVTLLSIWPTPDLSERGWSLVGHPAVVVRGPGPVEHEPPPGVEVRVAVSDADRAAAERVTIEGYPMPEAQDLPAGALYPSTLADRGITVRLALLDGEPAGIGNVHVGEGLVNLCLGATMPAARRRGVWQSLVWARVAEDPELPAVAYTSDDSRPGFIRMGFVPVTRFTLWARG